MPAPVPPGYTRGPLLFLGSAQSPQSEAVLLQRFWSEAGGYGARLLLLATVADAPAISRLSALFEVWEAEQVTVWPLYQRTAAQQAGQLAHMDEATGILLLETDPLHLTMRLGGTPVAQAIRRANARGKVVGGLGLAATTLCQHMLLPDTAGRPPMAPGLGLVNRLGLAVQEQTTATTISQLLLRVAYNPFLIGVSLERDTGLVVYPDTTLEVFGQKCVHIVDGGDSLETDPLPAASASHEPPAGWHIHRLTAGCTFNFDQRTVQTPSPTDIPLSSLPASS